MALAAKSLARGAALHRAGNLNEAEAIYEAVLATHPKEADALNLLGMVKAQRGDWEECARLMGEVARLKPKNAEAHYSRGVALKNLKRFEEALGSYDKAIAADPKHVLAHSNRGAALETLRRFDEALASYEKAIALKPDFAEGFSNRGFALEKLNRYEEALASYDRAIALKPAYAEAHNNRGLVLAKLGRYEESEAAYDKAIALKPDYANSYWNKALLYILLGRYEEGWKLYEWRWKSSECSHVRVHTQPLWLGEAPLAGKTILIYAEQGLGDTIQFCRYVPMAALAGAQAILAVPAALVPLLSDLKGAARVVAEDGPLPHCDLCCPFLSLPLAFKTALATVPAEIPYLFADPAKRETWQERLGEKTQPRIGVVWAGRAEHINDHNRSIAAGILAPLWELPYEFHSLQKEARPGDAIVPALSHAGGLADFSDTAALLAEMDLVITVDTAVAHLAGALGKRVWILLPFAADYRWMAGRGDSPWYPSARLFRQVRPGDWAGVIADVAAALTQSSWQA